MVENVGKRFLLQVALWTAHVHDGFPRSFPYSSCWQEIQTGFESKTVFVGASRCNIPGMKGGALMREWKTEGGGSERLSDEETIAARDGVDGCSTPSPGM